jgi:UDP-N-acetylglucosamine:LPS N-acetylglucosamine transferase
MSEHRGGQRVLMVCSSGGHLAQLMLLKPWLEDKDVAWVTFQKPDAVSQLRDERVTYCYYPTTRNIKNLIRNTYQAISVIRRERPDLIVSNGAAIAFPYFVLGWVLRIPRVFIEVVDRIETPTLTGRLCRPFSSEFLVQWEEQQQWYPGSRVVGSLM